MARTNTVGLERTDYKAQPSTLCPGCGHDSIANQVITMAYDLGLQPQNLVKFSGIGCSSKSLAYFWGRTHGFNAVHGRMPSVATGTTLANTHLHALGISGDGDTGSIGLGQFKHMVRRNVPIVYIIENNGVYGLTKGQFSATADLEQSSKYYGLNELPPVDLALEAIIGGATFVARSFSGDASQVQQLLKAAINHRGTAVLDVISPCVTFNNRPESTKSYPYGKEHEIPLHEIEFLTPDFIETKQEITVDGYTEGEVITVDMHDGSYIRLKKLGRDHDPRNRRQAIEVMEQAEQDQLFLTGLIYYEEPRPTLADTLHIVDEPLRSLPDDKLRPSADALDSVMHSLM